MQFISKEVLDKISYESTLGQSLRQISLRKTVLSDILADVDRYRSQYTDIVVQENLIGSRFKSNDSIMRKYEKTLRAGGGFKQCFNDVLGFRLYFKEYPEIYPEYFRVVDLRKGKRIDDGYRAVHLYYQRDNLAYPIEIQLWCGADFQYNIWSHKYIYKYDNADIGKVMYQLYVDNEIHTEWDFIEKLEEMRGDKNGR